MTMQPKKCTPLRCKTFSKIATQIENKRPVDIIVVNCPYRQKGNTCTNEAESFKGATY